MVKGGGHVGSGRCLGLSVPSRGHMAMAWPGLIVAEAVRDGGVVGEFWKFVPTGKRTGR